jgi:hypothetical protein
MTCSLPAILLDVIECVAPCSRSHLADSIQEHIVQVDVPTLPSAHHLFKRRHRTAPRIEDRRSQAPAENRGGRS